MGLQRCLYGRGDISSLPPSCRAILVLKDTIVPMSCEFTPETERQRLQHLVSDSFHTSDNQVWSRRACDESITCFLKDYKHCGARMSFDTCHGGL